jgi:hypothetical protein
MRAALLVAMIVAGGAASADEPPPAPAVDFEERVRQLEAEVKALKARQPPQPAALPQPAAPASAAGPLTSLAEGTTRTATRANLTIGGYAEIFYQWNFNEPSNGITHYRGFDNRHNAFTISNAVVDAAGSIGPVSARIALQVGHTPETYYKSEPPSPPCAPSALGGFCTNAPGAGSTNAAVWKYLQQANAAVTFPIGRGLLLEGGIFLSPVGPEGMAVKDQWNWSRSNLFFGLPFYHTGVRLSYPFTSRITVALAVFNGWNSVVDNNPEKSVAASFNYVITDKLTYQLLYFGGVERAAGAGEGRAWRHLFDTYLGWYPRKWLSLLAHVNAGFEPNRFGISRWAAGALYARVRPLKWLYLAARGDFFWEGPTGPPAAAAPIFWPVGWVSSGTLTVDARPFDNVSLRVEYRHDHADADLYFNREVPVGFNGVYAANATSQDTITLGLTSWF